MTISTLQINDEKIAVAVRLDTAIMALRAALEIAETAGAIQRARLQAALQIMLECRQACAIPPAALDGDGCDADGAYTP